MRHIELIVHNVRSAHNVGSILRTAEGLGVEQVYLTGYTPYPNLLDDKRLPHEAAKVHNKIAKTALGAESKAFIKQNDDINKVIHLLKTNDFKIIALEQVPTAKSLEGYSPDEKVVLIVGRETEGIEQEVLEQSDLILQIPMLGQKESFNVCQAAAMALYHLRFT